MAPLTKQERRRLKNARQKAKREAAAEDLFWPPRVPAELENRMFSIDKGLFKGIYSGKVINEMNDAMEAKLKERSNETENDR